MAKKKKATEAAPKPDKGSNSSRIMQQVRAVFLSGQKVTAREINSITGSNDARKVISTLRASGWNIQDLRLSDGCKLYWLVKDDRQLSLFEEGGSE